jgi:mono/diheme cytochrome c family protein
MPRMFGSDRRGEVERYAVASFLAIRGSRPTPRRLDENQHKNWPVEGKTLFESVGCTVCHEAHDDAGKSRPARATLRKLGQKTSVEALATFIHNPATSDPAGRMPALAFANGDDPFRLALYLTSRDAAESQPLALPRAPEPAEIREALAALSLPAADIDLLAQKPPIDQLMTLARRTMRARRCTSCHEMKVAGEEEFWKPLPAAHDFAAIGGGAEGGCLDLQRNPGGAGIPVFGSSLEAGAGVTGGVGHVRAFLKAAAVAPGTAAPGETARLILARFNCTGCHDRHGAGGLPSGLVARMLVNQSEQNAESVSPPPLTGIAGKLLGPAIRQALEGSLRSRPWMSLQMPRFDTAQLAPLPAALAAADGLPLREEAFRPPADEAVIAAGRTLVGEKGFSCTKCHDMLGIPSLGTRGPELARVAERVNYDWYLRWMTDPQRLQPGTRMPTVFFGGKSAYTHILDGVPDKQRLAIWQYLLVCRNLPYPEGLRPPQKLRFPDSSAVQVVRTFLPETSARGIAVRSPDQLHLAFDAQS